MDIKKYIAYCLPDSVFLKIFYRKRVGKRLNLKNPTTFTEKLQWIKLYDRKPLYETLVDKYDVKEYVAARIGPEHLIPTYGVWDRFEDIDFDALPDQFVLKCTHDSGSYVICKDKSQLDLDAVSKKLKSALKKNFYWQFREWPYKDVKHRIIAEKFMVIPDKDDLPDYKFYCFSGEVKFLMVASGRFSEGQARCDYLDRDFHRFPLKWGDIAPSETLPEKPANYAEMVEIAEKLSQGIPHVRVDLYECNGTVYFGEMTFFDGGGFDRFGEEKWDLLLGQWIKFPEKK